MEENRSLPELADLLNASYREHASIERLFYPDHPLPLAQCYLHLSLINEKSFHANKDHETGLPKMSRDYFLHDYERIHHNQRKLNPEQLLTECQHNPKRIYIEGVAGSGKTTLSRNIAYQWANHHPTWQHYAFVFRLRLRDVTEHNYKEDPISLMEVIQKECFGRGYHNVLNEQEKLSLMQMLKANPQKVLFILDGYDELSFEKNTIKVFWESIIYSHYDLIVTSRSGAQKASIHPNLQVAILGFSDPQVETYINYFFDPQHTPDANPNDANYCLLLFRRNTNLWSLAHTPIQLELLCSMWGVEFQLTT